MAPQATDLTDLDCDRTMIPDMVPCISIGSDVAIAQVVIQPTQLCVCVHACKLVCTSMHELTEVSDDFLHLPQYFSRYFCLESFLLNVLAKLAG